MKLKYPALLTLLIGAPSVFAQVSSVVINEVDADTPGTDAAEFVELYDGGLGNTDLSGLTLVFYNGSSDVSYSSFNLDGLTTNNSGYFVLCGDNSNVANCDLDVSPNTNLIQNGPDAVALYLGEALSFPSSSAVITDNLIDAIVYDTDDADDAGLLLLLNGGQPQVDERGNNAGDTESNQRCANGSGGQRNTSSYEQHIPTPGAENTCGGDSDGGDDAPDLGVISGSVCTNCPDVPKIKDINLFDAAVYYAAAQTEVDLSSSAQIIKAAITGIISTDHKDLSYADVWTSLTYTDEDPADTDNVILWYSSRSQAKSTNGSGSVASSNPDNWNREHSWPQSHGFSSDSFEARTDIHHLRATDISINGSRGNLDFDNSDGPLSESPINRVDGNSFEPRDDVKGDVARMMFYMDTRYEGLDSDVTPDLELVNRVTTTSESKLGWLCTLAAWNAADPVDTSEQLRNDRIYELQGNRNPFIDNPSWVDILYPVADCDTDGGGDDGGGDDGGDDGGGDGGGDDGGVSPINLFMSEYVEGGGNNKALEIYNNSSQAVDLTAANVSLARFSNGSSSGANIALTGTIPANGTYVVVHTSANADFEAKADQESGSVNHNGDDAYTLSVDGVVVDSFGQVGFDPGSKWGAGDTSSQNTTLVRKASVFTGDTVIDDVFDPATQWIGLPQDTFSELGQHEIDVRELFFSEYIEGSSNNKAIEIYNPNGTGLDLAAGNYSVELYSNGRELGDGPTNSLDLTGTIVGGDVYVIANSQADPAILDEADITSTVTFFNGDDALVLLKDGVPIDSIGRVGEDPGSAWTGNGVSTANNTIVRKSNITSGDSVLDDAFDPSVEWDGFPVNTFDSIGSHNASGGGEGPGDCCDEITFIHDVQDSGDVSPLDGDTVLVEGIVTAASSGIGGFFVQEEDADVDGTASTSEGIFVSYTGELPAVGSLVSVIGDVSESFARTQLTATEAPEVISTGNALPTMSALSLPFADAAQAESLEGMLVSTTQALLVTDNFTLGRFGQVTLSTERLFTPTNVFAPGSTEADDLAAANALNRILLDDGDSNQNPELIVFPTGGLSASNTLRLGDTVASLTGVMDFAFGDYRVIPTQEPTFVATNPRTVEPELNLGNVKVASLNVLNYFNNIDDSGSVCGPNASSSCRGADSDLEFERQKAKTVAAIVAMNADIVGLMEIENNGFSAGSAIDDLVAAINAIMGAGTYSIVDPGAAIGTDAITVAFIYKSSVVSLAGAAQILDSSNSISDVDGVLFVDTKNRPSLVQKFALLENGETLVISVNHLKSKGSSCGTGDDDTATGQGNCNLTRTRAAQALSAFLSTQFPDTATLIIGDLNAYAKEDPVSALEGAGYTNLVNHFGGVAAYSYSFSGRMGYLDHALANNNALAKVVDVTEWHINADEPISLDYNVEFKAPANVTNYYADDAYRMSDHDPVIIALQLDAASMVGDWDADGDVDVNDINGLMRAIQLEQVIDLSFDFNDDGVVNIFDVLGMSALCTRTGCAI